MMPPLSRRVFAPLFFFIVIFSCHAAPANLAASASAFVRSQADSRVNWQTWDNDWAKQAKAENKPVYVFVGAFLSELTQATCRQSFANAETADYLNQHFVCVLVDREERADFAAAAQHYIRTVKQSGGWPVNIWLTPDLQPFEGGGYLPPSEEWGKTGFSKVTRQAAEAWQNNPASCRAEAKKAIAMMAAAPPEVTSALTAEELEKKLAAATAAWRETFDAAAGGFSTAPKMPEPELLRFLLTGPTADREMALVTLRALRDRAVRDPLDGGFFRYASDPAWRIPYLQRTAADQARIALAFLEAHAVTHDESFAAAARGALDFALNCFGHPDGSFSAAEDGTADANLNYFTWTAAEIDAVAGKEAESVKRAFGVTPEGNVKPDEDPAGHFRGRNFLFHATPGATIDAATLGRLRAARNKRTALPSDDRATAAAHGWMIAALARAGSQLKEPRYLEAAKRTFAWTEKKLVVSERGDLRRWANADAPASPLDYVTITLGCRELAKTVRTPALDSSIQRLLARATTLFFDPAQGVFLCAPPEPPAGIFFRAPASDEGLEAEALAVLVGSDADTLGKTLADALVPNVPTAGQVLLALRVGAERTKK